MKKRKWIIVLVVILLTGILSWWVISRRQDPESGDRRRPGRAVPVETAEIQTGPILLRRTFSGTLESTAEFIVAPKVSGRIVHLAVGLADRVERGQVVARLDNAEYVQAVAQAQADLAVARAGRSEAQSALEIAERELKRIEILRTRGVASESQLDTAKAQQLRSRANLEVAGAQVIKAEAMVETAKIKLGYTTITADWTGGDDHRLVAERLVDEGDTVSANAELLSIVELDPITGVVFATEREYGRLKPGQSAVVSTDAFIGETFIGRVSRIAPVFRTESRQARVELVIENKDQRLRPGMFIRTGIVLDKEENAVIVPIAALTRRNDQTGIFTVNADEKTVSWREVESGIQEGERIQVVGSDLSGEVVTLGQHLLEDGSAVIVPQKQTPEKSSGGKVQKP